jgi:hypothetical protein
VITGSACCSLLLLGSEGAKPLVLLLEGLEATVSNLGGSINELNLDVLGHPSAGSGEDRLAHNEGTLADAHDATLDEEVVLVDLTVVGETTERSDVLLNGIVGGGSVVENTTAGTSTDTVDLLVDLSTRVVTHLTTTGNSPLDARGMPGTDTADLAETSMSLTGKSVDAESLDGALGSLTLGNTDGVDDLVVLEDLSDADFLLELVVRPLDLVSDGATVNLDLHNVRLDLAEVELVDLGGAENADGAAVLLDALKVALDGALGLVVLLEAVSVLGEGLLLGVHPVLVEATLDVVVELGGPDGGESAHAAGSLDVADHADDLHGGALNDGASVDDVLLDHLLTFATLEVLDDVGHAGLVAHEGGEVDGLGLVVLGEVTYAATVVTRAALGKVGKGALARVFKLTVRHLLIIRSGRYSY